MNFDDFMKKFFEFEQENDLINLQYKDVYVWVLVRNRIQVNIARSLKLSEATEYTVPTSFKARLKTISKYLWIALKNQLTPYDKVDEIIFSHSRKVLKKGAYKDIYSEWYEDQLIDKGTDYLVLDTPLNWSEHLIEFDKNHRPIENFGVLSKIFTKFFYKSKYPSDIQAISNLLIEKFGFDGNFINEVNAQFHAFNIDKKHYLKLLRKTQAKKVVYVVKNSFHPLISAANDLNIPVWEIQHGVMGIYNMMYSYPNAEYVPYFPDGMYLLSELWLKKTPMPLKAENVEYYEGDITKNAIIEDKADKQVVLLSQSTIAHDLIKFLETNVDSKYKFIFKLHPSEFHVWKEIYPKLETMNDAYSNLEVVDTFEKSLEEILSTSKYLVGVNSTSILEGMYVCVKPFILEASGSTLMTELLEQESYALVQIDSKIDFDELGKNINLPEPSQIFYNGNTNN